MMSSIYPYSHTITMRRSRNEIINSAKNISDPTINATHEISPQRILSRIVQLSNRLDSSPQLSNRLKDKARRLVLNALDIKQEMYRCTPEWRRLDKSLSN